jgi:hypothetical protein
MFSSYLEFRRMVKVQKPIYSARSMGAPCARRPPPREVPAPVTPTKWKQFLWKFPQHLPIPSYIPQSCQEARLIEQSERNDPARDVNVSEQPAELLGSRLQSEIC